MTKPKPSRPIVLAVWSDTHPGSTVGLCPPEGVKFDDGGDYTPSKPQRWLWECMEKFCSQVEGTRRQHHADLYGVCNGDAAEGNHHGTTQIVSGNPDAQNYLTLRAFDPFLALEPDRLWIVRGTEAHTGPGGSTEEALAKALAHKAPVVRDQETNLWSYWHLRLAVHGLLLDFQHHGRAGGRPWTRQNTLSAQACEIWMEHSLRSQRAPDLAIRSHRHVFGDSYGAYPTRVIQTPAFQLKTAFGHQVAANAISDIGGIIVTLFPDSRYEVEPVLFQPALPRAWSPA